MTKDDIIRMAREAWFPDDLLTDNMVFLLERFAAVEREACARMAEEPYELTSDEAHRINCACVSADARWCYQIRYDVAFASDYLDDGRCECGCHSREEFK